MDIKPQLNLFGSYGFTDAYWSSSAEEQRAFRRLLSSGLSQLGEASHLYRVFPSRADTDILLWTAQDINEPGEAANILTGYARAFEPWRQFLKPVQTLWGFTKPSMYSRGKSEQDIEAITGARSKFLIIYPFSKDKDWYLMSFDARQGMMNEHIKLGKQYFDVKQLLIYSFGLQDQEFVVSYEMEELPRFSELVQALRSTEGRRYTLLDSPIITCCYQTAEEFVGA